MSVNDRGSTRASSRTRSGRAVLVAAIAILALAVGASISGAATGKRSAVNPTLNWAIGTNPASLFDAYYFRRRGLADVLPRPDHILQPGVFGQPTTGPEAAVSSWKAVNPTTYVYTVKPGIKFSDGTTMTAKDVAFSMNMHRDKKTGSKMFSTSSAT